MKSSVIPVLLLIVIRLLRKIADMRASLSRQPIKVKYLLYFIITVNNIYFYTIYILFMIMRKKKKNIYKLD